MVRANGRAPGEGERFFDVHAKWRCKLPASWRMEPKLRGQGANGPAASCILHWSSGNRKQWVKATVGSWGSSCLWLLFSLCPRLKRKSLMCPLGLGTPLGRKGTCIPSAQNQAFYRIMRTERMDNFKQQRWTLQVSLSSWIK